MKCKYCGNELIPGKKFCTECGNRVVEKRICPNCGTENEKRFCTECGYDLDSVKTESFVNQQTTINGQPVNDQPSYDGVYNDQQPNKKPLVIMVTILALLVGLGLGVSAYFMYKPANDHQEVIKEEIRLEQDDKNEYNEKIKYPEDIGLVSAIPGGNSIQDTRKLVENACDKVDKDHYETTSSINGHFTYYDIYFEDDEYSVEAYNEFDNKKDYEDTMKFLKDYLDSHYQRDVYDLEENENELIYDDEVNFIMIIKYDDDNGFYLYRTSF